MEFGEFLDLVGRLRLPRNTPMKEWVAAIVGAGGPQLVPPPKKAKKTPTKG